MGLECSGTIEKVGQNVKGWKIGEKVCVALSGGGYAEKVVVKEWELFLIPVGVSFLDAACLPHASCVVWSELFMQTPLNSIFWLPDDGKKARLSGGQTLLVHEDCNGISNLAIQLAKQQSVNVTATYRSDGFHKHCGNVEVALMSQDDFLNGALTHGIDLILNTLGPEHFQKNLSNLERDGIMISTSTCCSDIIDSSSSLPSLADKTQPNRRVIQAASLLYRSKEDREKKNMWGSIQFVQSIQHFVHGVYPFSKAGEAHMLMEDKGCGKIILVPDTFYVPGAVV